MSPMLFYLPGMGNPAVSTEEDESARKFLIFKTCKYYIQVL